MAINARGEIVGASDTADGATHATLWRWPGQ
jgi:probable HAF family extracellular repeat protein